MRKKIFIFTFLISLCAIGVYYYFAYKPMPLEVYNLESESLVLTQQFSQEDVNYRVNHYFPKLDGTYDVQTETLTGQVGDIVNANSIVKTGFSFDSENTNNILSGTVAEGLELKLYYVRKQFRISISELNSNGYGKLIYSDGTEIVNAKTHYVPFGSSIYIDGEELVVGEYRFKVKPAEKTAQYSYSFKQWSFKNITPDSNGVYTIVDETKLGGIEIGFECERVVNSYKVSWKNEGKLIYEELLEYGELPSYTGTTPTKKATQQYTYTFSGWNPKIDAVTGNVEYNAVYSSTVNSYTVTFNVLEKESRYGNISLADYSLTVPYGTKIVKYPSDVNKISIGTTTIMAKPAKSSAQYEYSLDYWEIPYDEVRMDFTINVKFKRIEKTYTILWYSNNNVIEIDNNQSYGSMPEYNGKEPVREATAEFTYKFTGWSPKVSLVTQNKEYHAQFSETRNNYKVEWIINNNVVEIDESVPYGEMPEYNGEEPALEHGTDFYFVFEGWFNEVAPVTGNVRYEAVFSKWYIRNTVDNEDRVYIESSGLRNDVVFAVEEIHNNRLFVTPKGMEIIATYNASLTKGNEKYIVEDLVKVVIDLKEDYDENREYQVYIYKNGELVEAQLEHHLTTISFFTDELSTFVVFGEKIKTVNLIWLICLLSTGIVLEGLVFYFIIVKRYREYQNKMDTSRVNSSVLIGLPLVIRIVSTGALVSTIILSVLFLGGTVFLIFCFIRINQIKNSLPDEGDDFIYIPTHEEEETDVETCPLYTGPKRDLSQRPKQTYYDTPYRPIYYYQHIPIYQNGPMNVDEEDVNDDEIVIEDGEIVRIHYKRSFMSRIIQGSKEVQDFYTRLRNEIAAYPKLKSRVGWEHESIYTLRETIILIKVKGDILNVFLALDPNKYNKSKINFGDVGKIKKYKNVPMLIRVKEEKDLNNVLELLDQICKKNKLIKETIGNEDYHYEFRTDKELIDEGLIKEVKTYSGKIEEVEEEILTEDMIRSEINVSDAKEALTDEQALALIETIESVEDKSIGNKKTIVNIGTLSRFFEPNDTVDLSSLKAKKIISKDTGYVKILASGVLDKPLNVVANSYSIDAVKMILLTGGKVTKN